MRKRLVVLMLVVLAVVAAGCAPATPPFFAVTLQAIDEKGAPVAGALLQTSDGQSLATDSEGRATVRWARIGTYSITVYAEGRMPATLTVVIPEDTGKVLTATLPRPEFVMAPPPEVPPAGTPPAAAPPPGPGAGTFAGAGVPFMMAPPATMGPGQVPGAPWAYAFAFQALFSLYGYGLDLAPYGPGQWTEWEAGGGSGQPLRMRKAFLGYVDGAKEWWQVRIGDEAVIEMLFSEGRQSVRRLRQRLSGDEAPREMPVPEGWYAPPLRLTPESLEGAVVERGVEVRVPAGTFRADRLEFGVGPGLVLRMWRATDVPGGIVRYELRGQSGEGFVVELTGFGEGAASELGSF